MNIFVNALMLKISIFSQITLILLVKKWLGEAGWYGFSKNNACHQSGCPEFSSWNPLGGRRELIPSSCLLTSTQALRYVWIPCLFSLSAFPLLSLQYTHMYMCVHAHTHKKMTKNPPANGDKSVFKILKLAKKNIFLVNIGINNLWFWNEVPVPVVSGNTNILSKDNGHKCTLCIMRLLLPKYFPINHRIWIIMNKINPTVIRYSGIHI